MGVITTFAGDGTPGFSGDDGPAASARLSVASLVFDAAGNLLLADFLNRRVRRITPAGIIQTVAGTGAAGFSGDNGPATAAQLRRPAGIAVNRAGSLYIADADDHRIRKVAPDGVITTVAGSGSAGFGPDGSIARFSLVGSPQSVAVDAAGTPYFSTGGWIRRLDSDGTLRSFVQLASPRGMRFDGAGNLYVADANRIVRVSPSREVATVAGGASGFGGDGGRAEAAALNAPADLLQDRRGYLLIADRGNHRVRQVDLTSIITTIAGGRTVTIGDGGRADQALLSSPRRLAVDAAGNVYIADTGHHRIRRVTPAGQIGTFAGIGVPGFSGDGGPPESAALSGPLGISLNPGGTLYIADTGNNRVRKIQPSDGVIATVPGTRGCAGLFVTPCFFLEPIFAEGPLAVVEDQEGTLYVAARDRVVLRDVVGNVSTVPGSEDLWPVALVVVERRTLYAADSRQRRIARISLGRVETIEATPATDLALDRDGNLFIAAGAILKRTPAGEMLAIPGAAGVAVAVGPGGILYVADDRENRVLKLTPNSPVRLVITRGDRLSGRAGTRLPEPLEVRLIGAAGAGVLGAPVTFAVTQGAAALSSPRVTTSAEGIAQIAVTLGAPGTVVVTASSPGVEPARFTMEATPGEGAAPEAPRIFSGGVVGGGLSVPPARRLSPNGIVSVFGENLAPPGPGRLAGPNDLVNGRLPTRLDGVCVRVGSEPAPIFHLFRTQINIQAPSGLTAGEAPVQVIRNCGEPGEVRGNTELVRVEPAAPEFLFTTLNPDGRNPIRMVNATDPEAAFARPGDAVILFVIGLGFTDPPFAAGELPDRAAPARERVKVWIGEKELADEDVLYAGVTPLFAGLYQINLRIPPDTPASELPVSVRAGSFTTPPGGFLVVRRD